jgi:hypothetical protein
MALVRQAAATITYDITSAPFNVGSILIENLATVNQSAGASQLNAGSLIVGQSSGGGSFNLAGGTTSLSAQLVLGQNGGGAGTFGLTGGAFSALAENIGSLGNGSFIQTGGSNTADSINIGASTGNGFYRLDGGALSTTGTITLGANGSFTSNGAGSLSTSGTTFLLAGGIASGTINTKGTFISNSGTLAASAGSILNSGGTFIYNGGDHSAFQIVNTGTAIFNADWTAKAFYNRSGNPVDFGARTINLTQGVVATNISLENDGIISLNGGTLNVAALNVFEVTGNANGGTFNHNSGTNHAANLLLGNGTLSAGVYTLASGTLNVDASEIVGQGGDGTFTQNGGTQSAGDLFAGVNAGSAGSFLLSGGSASYSGFAFVGYGGAGNLQQTSGRFSSASLRVAESANSTGTVLISGGSLTTASVVVANDANANGTFLQQGGSVSVSGAISLGNFITTAKGTYTLLAGSLTSGQVTVGSVGTGTFSQLGGTHSTGTVTIASSAASSGRYTLSGGTLTVANSINLASGGQFIQNGGALSVGSFNTTGPILTPYSFNAGLLHLTGSSFTIGSGGLLGANVSTSITRSFVIDQATQLDPLGLLIVSGGTFSTGSFINNGGSIALNSGTLALTNSGLTIGAGQPLGSNVKLDYGTNLSVANTLTIDSGALLQLNGATASASSIVLPSGAELVLTAPTALLSSVGPIATEGLIHGTGRITAGLENGLNGQIRVDDGDTLRFTGNFPHLNAGRIVLNGGRLEFASGSLLNQNNGAITGRGSLVSSGGITNTASMTFSAGTSDVFGAVTNNNRINITGGSTTTFWNNVSTSAGTINVNTDSTVVFAGNLTGQSHVTGPGVKDYEGTASGGAIASLIGDTLVGESGIVTADYLREDDVQIFGSLSVAPNGTAANVSRVNSLSIASGKLDLADNDLIANNTSLSTIQSYIASGFGNGNWNGDGIISRQAALIAANNTDPHKTGLGYAEASSLGITSFDGQSVSGSNVLVRYTYLGDLNLDGVVNALDFNQLATNYGAANGKIWVQGDFNYDGLTNSTDFSPLAVNFNRALPSPALGSLVPEPVTLLYFALPLALRRRRATIAVHAR